LVLPLKSPLTSRTRLGCTTRVDRLDARLDVISFARAARRAHTRLCDRLTIARLLATAALLACAPAMAQIYVGSSGADSAVVLSNFQTTDTPVLLVDDPAARAKPAPSVVDKPARAAQSTTLQLPAAPAELKRLVADVAAEVQISPNLLHAVIAAESAYNPRALSPKGAVGLMQLMPATAARFGAQDPYVARQNVRAGASYLKWLMARFRDDMELVLAAYNAGEQAVLKAGNRIPPYPETQAYVPRVLGYLRCASSASCAPT